MVYSALFLIRSANTPVKGHDTNTLMAPINNMSDVIDVDEFVCAGDTSHSSQLRDGTLIYWSITSNGCRGSDRNRQRIFLSGDFLCWLHSQSFPKGNHPLLHISSVFTKIHNILIPWTISLNNKTTMLCSNQCARKVVIKATKKVKPCASCINLHNHTISYGHSTPLPRRC